MRTRSSMKSAAGLVRRQQGQGDRRAAASCKHADVTYGENVTYGRRRILGRRTMSLSARRHLCCRQRREGQNINELPIDDRRRHLWASSMGVMYGGTGASKDRTRTSFAFVAVLGDARFGAPRGASAAGTRLAPQDEVGDFSDRVVPTSSMSTEVIYGAARDEERLNINTLPIDDQRRHLCRADTIPGDVTHGANAAARHRYRRTTPTSSMSTGVIYGAELTSSASADGYVVTTVLVCSTSGVPAKQWPTSARQAFQLSEPRKSTV
jgi:hypothetical protein